MFAVARPMKNGALCTSLDSPVAGGSVVELVGLEPTTKVLWNMVRVRPTARINGKTTTPTIWMGPCLNRGRDNCSGRFNLVVMTRQYVSSDSSLDSRARNPLLP